MPNNSWIGVDFDGTLAKYTGWQGKENLGEPIDKMVRHVLGLIEQGKTVKIFTARIAEDPGAKDRIQKWLVKAGLPKLDVTNEKDQGMEYLIDDRVKQVVPNKGIFVSDQGIKSVKNFKGLTIMIENPVGSTREGKDVAGNPWKTNFHYDYGYIYGTRGVDDDGIDVFLGNDLSSDKVFVIHQTEGHGIFDEDKVMLGFGSLESARDAYLAHYNTQGYIGQITEMPFFEFKTRVLSPQGRSGRIFDNK